MGDLISRQAALDAINEICERCGEGKKYNGVMCGACNLDGVADIVEDLPSAQPDIIVCANCKYWICHDKRCGYWNHGAKLLEWCCHAERRTDE